ncbi:MAG: glycoside hydrolase family 99-like domain-containing protein [Acidisphaera sp.]|nr:glycoside hydrolase family 99-like domain-containing protein [Acidisphaera sp.]
MSPADFLSQAAEPWIEAARQPGASRSSTWQAPDWDTAFQAAGVEVLRRSGLFDAPWYQAAYPDRGVRADPLRHFVEQGWRMGHRPNLYFDPAYYLACNQDVRELGVNPLLHYISYGEREGRHPILHFDPAWYRTANGLAEDACCLLHFLQLRRTGRVSPIPEFDAAWYLRAYPDVADAGMDPMEHYLVQGFREARNPSGRFDSRYYRMRYLQAEPDENPLLHYLRNRDAPGVHPCMPEHETSIAREVRRFTRPGPDFEEFRPLPASAPRRARVLAYYLPQFHPVPENERFWGRGFTEWTNLQRALPRFGGHYQPRIPRDLGHYTLDAGVLRRQIDMARGAGLGGFVFYFYWFNGRRLMDKPLEAFLADRTLDFPFCLMWANENWTRRWDGSEAEVLVSQDYHAEDEPSLLATFARHFADPRYIRIGGRPLLMVYRPRLMADPAATLARWRARFDAAHGEQPIFITSQSFGDHDPTAFGMDAAIEFPPHKLVDGLATRNDALHILDHEFSAQVYDYDALAAASLAAPPPPWPLIRTAIPGWDNDARRQGAGLVVHGATPAKYQAWFERLVRQAQERPFFGEALVCINAWNEWAEGAYLEPDLHFGAAFLNATGRAVAGLVSPANAAGLLLIGHDAFPAGSQHLLLHLGRQLRRVHGVRVGFLLLDGGALEAEYAAVAPVTVARDTADASRRLEELHAAGFRTAIVNTCAAAQVCPLLAKLGITATLLVHELPRLIEERGLLEAARQGAAAARHVVFAAGCVRDRFAALVPLDPARAVVLAQGCYRQPAFSAEARARLRRHWGLGSEDVLALGMGYADLRKGFDLFLQVWRALRRRGRRVHLAWAGAMDPAMQAYLGAEIAAAEATGSFRLLGWREDVGDVLSAADLLLLTSREDPLPTTVLEAMSVGTPVLAFAESGGAPELLLRHRAGEVVPLADTEAMARRVAAHRPPRRAARQRLAEQVLRSCAFGPYAESLLRLARPGLPAISAVVLSHQYARYLRARLASIFAQTCPVLEVIVLDDASTDGSVSVAREAADSWERDITVVENATNSGSVFAQWRRAAELARGDFIWLAEADDACEPRFLERLAEALARAPDTLLGFCDSRSIDAEDRPIAPSYRDYYERSAGAGALAHDDLFEAAGFARRFLAERNLILNVSGVLWRRSALLEALRRCAAELPRWRLAGDWRLYSEALKQGGSVAYVAEALNIHRRHEAGTTRRLETARHLREIARMHAHLAALPGAAPDLRARQRRYLREVAATLAARPGVWVRPAEAASPEA